MRVIFYWVEKTFIFPEMLEETDDEESEPLRTTDDNQDSKVCLLALDPCYYSEFLFSIYIYIIP